jgi:hypothetical protein
MVLAGFLTVILSFLIMGWAAGLGLAVDAFRSGQDMSFEDLIAGVMMGPVFVLFGTIFTLGVPYLIGLFSASLFADDPETIEV